MPTTLPPVPISDFDKDAARYERNLKNIFNPLIRNFDRKLEQAENHYYAIGKEIDAIPNELASQGIIGEEAKAHYGVLKNKYTSKFERMMSRYLGINVVPMMQEDPIARFMQRAIADNVDLIGSIPEKWKGKLKQDLLELQNSFPFDQQRVKRVLRNRYDYVGFKLDLITSDQTGKAIGKFTQIRQTQAGISRYQWQSSEDEVVRPRHQELNNEIYTWESGGDPLEGHPGEPIRCRCNGLGIVENALQEFLNDSLNFSRSRYEDALVGLWDAALYGNTCLHGNRNPDFSYWNL